MVFLRLAVNGLLQCLPQFFVAHAAAQQMAQVNARPGIEAELQEALSRQPHAVARGAELMLHRIDEADLTGKARGLIVDGRAVHAMLWQHGAQWAE